MSDLSTISENIRRSALVSIHAAESGHPGGVLSCVDILSYLYSNELEWGGDNSSSSHNQFILSKGHACPSIYAAAAEFGVICYQDLLGLRKLGSALQGHPHVLAMPWVETSTGSLGQGFSVAIGKAMGMRHQDLDGCIYVMLGDGELQEGEVWEAAMCASHYQLGNLCAIIDYNKMQSDDLNENIMNLEPLVDKWRAFNWHTIEIDGHDFQQIEAAIEESKATLDRPVVIIAHTIKGKGVSFMENSPLWHGSVKLREEELVQALRDLRTPDEAIQRYLQDAEWGRMHGE